MKVQYVLALVVGFALLEFSVAGNCLYQLWHFSEHPVWLQVFNSLLVPFAFLTGIRLTRTGTLMVRDWLDFRQARKIILEEHERRMRQIKDEWRAK
jgi:hypothetical protein